MTKVDHNSRLVLISILGMALLGIIAMMTQWAKEGWLTRWWLPQDPILTLLLCGFIGAAVGVVSIPFVVPSLRRAKPRAAPVIVYGINGIVVILYVLIKPTGLTGPLSAAIVALIGVCMAAWIISVIGERPDPTLPRFGLRFCLLFIVFIAVLCFIYTAWEKSTRESRLINAAYQGDISSVRELLSRGANIQARDGWSGTPLMYAARWGHKEIVVLLIQNGAALDERSRMNQTPLMHAAASGHKNIVEYLIECGADGKLRDENGMSAADLARENGHSTLASQIEAMCYLPQ